jgi:lipopolysaccharide transport system permease protein
VANARLLTKVYVPRLVIPLASVLAGLVDLAVSLVLLVLLLAAYRVVPGPGVVWLPFFLLLAVINAAGFGLWLAALNVRYRDVGYAVPFVLQIGMYLTPVVYGIGLVPERYRLLLAWNPMAGVADGLRRSLLGAAAGPGLGPAELALSTAVAVLVLLGGLVFFRASERTFADVV